MTNIKSNHLSRKISSTAILLILFLNSYAQEKYVTSQKAKNSFILSSSGKSSTLFVSAEEFPGVIRALKDLQTDIGTVTGAAPQLITGSAPSESAVIVGTIGKSAMIDDLIRNKKINADVIRGKWETFILQTVENPVPGVKHGLVIAGSDKRGTIFGIYDLSSQIGVSPWQWWADVPVKKSKSLYVSAGTHSAGEPLVKYRGIFINDEAPALAGWVAEKFPSTQDRPNGFNHLFYTKVFQLILRMKGNYLWPAMWGRAFYDDDPVNPKLADEFGIVIGTSHHEPMMRAHVEWERYGNGGKWNYEENGEKLRDFWTEGITRMGNNESIVSMAMRGDGDMAMAPGTNIALLEKIVKDQREIITKVTGKDPSATPQLWALYKEVQDYYDNGMRVPDDITLLLCDDNWGNIRKLPKQSDPKRSGGYGVYYHFDYVGGPRNYKWINTNAIPRIWEQMNMAYEYGVDRIWIVNVGDIKPMEYPTEFFLDMAWNPRRFNADNIGNYPRQWAEKQFGEKYAREIGNLLSAYTKFNARRKPEMITSETYSLINYQEAETVVNEFNQLTAEAQRVGKLLPSEYQDAYYQLVLHPVMASANLNELYLSVAKNKLYAAQGRASANDFSQKAKDLFAKDAEISEYYNQTMAGGKWHHMMDQTHIGYTYWQQPAINKIPETKEIVIPDSPEMGIAIEGSDKWWPAETSEAWLPELSFANSTSYLDIFNRGAKSFVYNIRADKPWLKVSPANGTTSKEQRVVLALDWNVVPEGINKVKITVSGAGSEVPVNVIVRKKTLNNFSGFIESNGTVSINAEHFSKAVHSENINWKIIPDLGRTGSSVATFPVTAPSSEITEGSPHLEYSVYLYDSGKVSLKAYLSPTLNFNNSQGLRYGISIDDENPQVINLHDDNSNKTWESWVGNNIIIKTSSHQIAGSGRHVIKFWKIDSGVILQKIVVDAGGSRPAYLGPPESPNSKPKK